MNNYHICENGHEFSVSLVVCNFCGGKDVQSGRPAIRETQASINKWQNERFPNATLAGILKHLSEEFAEFLANPSSEEAADIIILLFAWAKEEEIPDLLVAVDKKMLKNRHRRWNIQPDGTGRHIKDVV